MKGMYVAKLDSALPSYSLHYEASEWQRYWDRVRHQCLYTIRMQLRVFVMNINKLDEEQIRSPKRRARRPERSNTAQRPKKWKYTSYFGTFDAEKAKLKKVLMTEIPK